MMDFICMEDISDSDVDFIPSAALMSVSNNNEREHDNKERQ
jgi:hypothetical protein